MATTITQTVDADGANDPGLSASGEPTGGVPEWSIMDELAAMTHTQMWPLLAKLVAAYLHAKPEGYCNPCPTAQAEAWIIQICTACNVTAADIAALSSLSTREVRSVAQVPPQRMSPGDGGSSHAGGDPEDDGMSHSTASGDDDEEEDEGDPPPPPFHETMLEALDVYFAACPHKFPGRKGRNGAIPKMTMDLVSQFLQS